MRCVLIIEDNLINMRLFEAFLSLMGTYEVLKARTGANGIELAQKHLPDLILLDIQLPMFSGLDVARALKADHQTRSIPIIAITALPPEEAILPRESGCDALLYKPVSIAEFKAALRSFLPSAL